MQPPPSTTIAPGDILAGKYQVERVLGRGGMGVVVAARHRDLGELFAIKLLAPEAAESPQAIERFLREARAAVRLKGEHVAKVMDVGRLENGLPFLVMEYLSGTDLRLHLRARGPLPVMEATTHILQACDAIAEAHSLGIIHRDLKPANLFLTWRANGTSCIKVLDFGVSKQLSQEALDLTKTGEALGTPLYMAPEQMARMKSADARCDVWSMGVVLYQLLTGTTPFHGTAVTEVVASVLQDEPLPPSRLRPDLPAWLDAVVMHCLQKRPDMRFQTIHELAQALRSMGMPQAQPVRSLPSSSDLTSSASALTPLSTGALNDLSGSAPDPATQPLRAPSLTQQAPILNTGSAWGATGHLGAAKRRGARWPWVVGGAALLVLAGAGTFVAVRSPASSPASSVGPTSDTPPIDSPVLAPTVAPAPPTATASLVPTVAPAPPAATASLTPASSEVPSVAASARASSAPSSSASAKPVIARPTALPPTPKPSTSRFGGIF